MLSDSTIITDKLEKLLDAGEYKVLIYTGDVDIIVSNAVGPRCVGKK